MEPTEKPRRRSAAFGVLPLVVLFCLVMASGVMSILAMDRASNAKHELTVLSRQVTELKASVTKMQGGTGEPTLADLDGRVALINTSLTDLQGTVGGLASQVAAAQRSANVAFSDAQCARLIAQGSGIC